MKETLKKWYQKLWKSDYELLEDPDGYSCTSWIIVKTIATTSLLIWLFAFVKDYNIVFGRTDLIVCIFVIPCVAAYVYVYVQINKSIAERKVFTYRNAHLWVILLLLFNSLGSMALNLAGWMIHKGIKMQEEQDLTI